MCVWSGVLYIDDSEGASVGLVDMIEELGMMRVYI